MRKLSISIGIGLVLVIIGSIWISYHIGKEEKPALKKNVIGEEMSRRPSQPSISSKKNELPSEPKKNESTFASKALETVKMNSKSETDKEIGEIEEIASELTEQKVQAMPGKDKIDEEATNEKTEKLPPELQRKIEIYAELSLTLPEFKSIWYASDDKGWLSGNTPAGARYNELLEKIIALCEPFIGPPAIRRDKRGVVQEVNFTPLFTQIAKYMGKELPFDKNPAYFSAEDYKGGTGGW